MQFDRSQLILLAFKGHPGSGKSALASALGYKLGWPVIDKDDIKDVLDGRAAESGGLAYEVMFNIARRELRLGLSTIVDSPLVSKWAFEHACQLAEETAADLRIVECRCADSAVWRKRIEQRQSLGLPSHHQTTWPGLETYLEKANAQAAYPISVPLLIVDTSHLAVSVLVSEVTRWLAGSRDPIA